MGVYDHLRKYVVPWWQPEPDISVLTTVDPKDLMRPPKPAEATPHTPPALFKLPPELLHDVFGYLNCSSLIALSRTCHRLRDHTDNDLLWANLVKSNLPTTLDSPSPFESWKSLYTCHHPYWFVPRHRIWFADLANTGKLILTRYDPRRSCIEGYQLVAEPGDHHFEHWDWNNDVIIHTFNPTVRLFLDKPILHLESFSRSTSQGKLGWWDGEAQMNIGVEPHRHMMSTFFLARSIPEDRQDPSMTLWPPPTIPTSERVRAATQDNFRGWGHKPQKQDHISEMAFRTRSWIQFTAGVHPFGVRMGEDVATWATMDPEHYMPTQQKPYQGIWVGDYAGHGCEFLVILQRDVEGSVDNQVEVEQEGGGKNIYRGRLEAVKITGDINVPRGEYTFIAEDIGSAGYIRTAQEERFKGARIVNSQGHVAARGFQQGKQPLLAARLNLTDLFPDGYIETQLILVSHDTLAQYWKPFGHISYYRRVDLDEQCFTKAPIVGSEM